MGCLKNKCKILRSSPINQSWKHIIHFEIVLWGCRHHHSWNGFRLGVHSQVRSSRSLATNISRRSPHGPLDKWVNGVRHKLPEVSKHQCPFLTVGGITIEFRNDNVTQGWGCPWPWRKGQSRLLHGVAAQWFWWSRRRMGIPVLLHQGCLQMPLNALVNRHISAKPTVGDDGLFRVTLPGRSHHPRTLHPVWDIGDLKLDQIQPAVRANVRHSIQQSIHNFHGSFWAFLLASLCRTQVPTDNIVLDWTRLNQSLHLLDPQQRDFTDLAPGSCTSQEWGSITTCGVAQGLRIDQSCPVPQVPLVIRMHSINGEMKEDLTVDVGVALQQHILNSASCSQICFGTLAWVPLGVDHQHGIVSILVQKVAANLDQVVNLHQARGSSQVQDQQKKPDPLKSQTSLKKCENKPALVSWGFSFLNFSGRLKQQMLLNYFTSSYPHHDIYTFCYWQIFWHSIWHIF